MKNGSLRNTSSESQASHHSNNQNGLYDSDSDDSITDNPVKRKERRNSTSVAKRSLPKFRHKKEDKKTNGRSAKPDGGKVRVNCCRYCDFTTPKERTLHRHFQRVRRLYYLLTEHYFYLIGP